MAVKQAGQIILFRFPHTDLTEGKLRPALLIHSLPHAHADWLICMISSQTHQQVTLFDDLMTEKDQDFEQSGLRTRSIIRATRLAVVHDSLFVGSIGEISPERLKRIKNSLIQWIQSDDPQIIPLT